MLLFMRRIQGFCVFTKAETSYIAVSQALLSSIILAECKETECFHSGTVAVVRISGSPQASPKTKKAHVGALWSYCVVFLRTFGGSKTGPWSPLGNRPSRAQNEPQEAPGPKRFKNTPKKDPLKVSKTELQKTEKGTQTGHPKGAPT